MTGLAFICGIAALFVLVFYWEGFNSEQGESLRPAGLLRWLVSGNWPAKVGATLLLISTGALLRYMLMNIEFPATGKIGVGIFAVAVLGGLSASLHDNVKRRAIHLALGGASLGIAYLTAYSAYDYFHFISSVQALGLLFIVACAATAFALESRAQSIAILSMVGAFIAPAFALEAPGVLPVYGYYLLASTLVLLMVALRGWRPLIHLSFLFTLAGALFFGWTQKFYEPAYFSQMHPLLLALVTIHLLMPLLELREAPTRGLWSRRFDSGYFLLLPLVSALLMILLAPNTTIGATGLLELGLLWAVAAGIQQWRFGAGLSRYGAVALALIFVAALLAFQDIPYFLMAAAASSLLLAASRVLRLSDGVSTALAIAALTFSAFYVMQSLLAPTAVPPFLNGEYLCHIILSASLLAAAYGSRMHKKLTITPVYVVFAVVWFAIASVRELIVLDLDFLPQLGFLAVLLASAGYAVLMLRRPPSMAIMLLLGLAMYLSGMFCARQLPTEMLFAAILAGQFVFLFIAHTAGRHLEEDGEFVAGIARSVLPVLMFPFVGVYSARVDAPHMAVIMSFLVSSALLASLHAQLTMPKGRFWPNTLSPVGFILFGLWLFYQTLFSIERNAWAIAYELIALLYIVQTALSLQRSGNKDARLFSIVAILALVATSAAMFLRAFGPEGTLTILAINQMLLPAVVSLFWAIVGGLMTGWAMRIQSRWFWVLGALLLVASAIKLVLFDFGSLGQLGNILAMMAAGCVFMVVAWLAPFPPKREMPEPPLVSADESERPDVPVRISRAAYASPDYAQSNDAVASSNRTWIWILAGLAFVFFLYQLNGKMRSTHSASLAAQTRVHESKAEQETTPPAGDKAQEPLSLHGNGTSETECSRFVSRLPEDDYGIYAAIETVQTGAHSINEKSRREIDVHVNKPGKKVLLVLSSNEFVTWRLMPVDGGRIIGVVLAGRQTGAITGLPAQTPVLRSSDNNGTPCAGFDAVPEGTQGVYRFISQLLKRAVDEVVLPAQGRVDFGVRIDNAAAPATLQKPMVAPYGIRCEVPEWNNPKTSCSGKVLVSGSMNNSDSPEVAAQNCDQARVAGSCCMYHLYGVGQWYLTDGQPQRQGRECEVEPNGNRSQCYAGGACTANKQTAWVR